MESASNLFNPKSIAVIGVSNDSSKLSTVIYNNILSGGFKGSVYPVNPKYETILDHKCYAKISDIKSEVDLAIIVIPSTFVFDSVKECADYGVKFAIIISAGFAETGSEGERIEKEIVEYANSKAMRIVGPNCLGILSSESSLNASFAAQGTTYGNVAFMSQSGAFNTALLDIADSREFGFKYFASLGNKSDVDEQFLIKNWLEDDGVKVIGAYLEEFENGRDLVELIKGGERKPIIMLTSGKSYEGKKAAASHTGSIATSEITVETALKEAGVINVNSIEKMFSHLTLFSWSPLPKGENVAIITNAGGPGIIATDLLSHSGLKMAILSEKTKKALLEILPSSASVENPVDLLGDALSIRYRSALEIVEKDDNVDSIILILTPQLVTQIEETARLIIEMDKVCSKPIIPIFIGEKYVKAGLERMWNARVPAFQYEEEAVAALSSLTKYAMGSKDIGVLTHIDYSKPASARLATYMSKDGNRALPQNIVEELVDEVGIDRPKESTVNSLDEAIAFASLHSYPLVLKATTEDVAHKVDKKLVYLDIKNAEDLSKSYTKIVEDLKEITGNPSPKVLIQEMVKANQELIIGVNYDPVFGHILLFGQGGIHAEVYKDSATRMLGISKSEIEIMISETKISKIIHGHRNSPKLAIDKIVETLSAIQKLVIAYPEIKSLDINPCMLTESRCISVDIKVFV